jgi:hypothetical protein
VLKKRIIGPYYGRTASGVKLSPIQDRRPFPGKHLPSPVRELQQNYPLEFWVQLSATLVFSDDDYRREGAVIAQDLGPCQVIIAIKEIPRPPSSCVFMKKGLYILIFLRDIGRKGESYIRPEGSGHQPTDFCTIEFGRFS